MRTVIFDAHNALWRLAKRMPILTAGTEQIQIVYGFLRLVKATIDDFEPNAALVVWDGEPVLRQHIFPGYKKRRVAKREERDHKKERAGVMRQADIIKQTLGYLAINQIWLKNSEADDLIAIACRALDGKKIIVSADHDMLQLVNEDVRVYSPMKGILYTHKNFEKKLGLTPRQFLEVRALIGDKSDEIPGVAKGFGEKTAKQLIVKYGNVANLMLPKIERKAKKLGSRHALLYEEGAFDLYRRNMTLMDLSIIHSKSARNLLRETMAQKRTVNRIAVLEYFKKKKFQSMLDKFSSWISTFEELTS